MSMYLTALFFEALRRTGAGAPPAPTLTASVPVNLRQFFPSTSARNFFATITVEHTYGEGDDSVGAVARHLQEDFSAEATPESLDEKLHRLIRVERSPFARIVPRPLKDTLLSLVNRVNNRSLTIAISNLGRVTLPEPAASMWGGWRSVSRRARGPAPSPMPGCSISFSFVGRPCARVRAALWAGIRCPSPRPGPRRRSSRRWVGEAARTAP